MKNIFKNEYLNKDEYYNLDLLLIDGWKSSDFLQLQEQYKLTEKEVEKICKGLDDLIIENEEYQETCRNLINEIIERTDLDNITIIIDDNYNLTWTDEELPPKKNHFKLKQYLAEGLDHFLDNNRWSINSMDEIEYFKEIDYYLTETLEDIKYFYKNPEQDEKGNREVQHIIIKH